MRSASLESFLFLFILKSFVAMGFPITDLDREDFLEDNNIIKRASISIDDPTASITSYTCVYIPSNLDSCNFISYKSREKSLLERKLREKRKRKLWNNNKKYLLRSSMPVPETEQFLKQKSIKTIIYEIQRCVPPRLPFIMPWCTDEELSDKKSEVRRLYPFVINDSSIATYEFPMYDFSRRTQTVSKTV